MRSGFLTSRRYALTPPNISFGGGIMKKCVSCGTEYEQSRGRCPKCGTVTSIQSLTAQGALSYFDSMTKGSRSGDLVNEGLHLFREGKYAEAEAKYKQAIETFPENEVAHGNMGHVLLKQGKIEEAIPWLEKALQLDPHLDGVPETLKQARVAMRKKSASLSEEQKRELRKPTAKSFWGRIWGRGRPDKRVRFLRNYQQIVQTAIGGSHLCSYERYEADSVADALTFLETKTVTQNYYYIEIETPDGLVGKDIKGDYKM